MMDKPSPPVPSATVGARLCGGAHHVVVVILLAMNGWQPIVLTCFFS